MKKSNELDIFDYMIDEIAFDGAYALANQAIDILETCPGITPDTMHTIINAMMFGYKKGVEDSMRGQIAAFEDMQSCVSAKATPRVRRGKRKDNKNETEN